MKKSIRKTLTIRIPKASRKFQADIELYNGTVFINKVYQIEVKTQAIETLSNDKLIPKVVYEIREYLFK